MSPRIFSARRSEPAVERKADDAGAWTAGWPKKAADLVDLVVDLIHDKAVRPVLLIARFVVFGFLVAALAPVVLILLSVALVRILDVYAFGGRVWITDFAVGALFAAGGIFAWARRGLPGAHDEGSVAS